MPTKKPTSARTTHHTRQSPWRGKDLHRLRQQAGLSVPEMAALLGCAPKTIWNIEKGHGTVSVTFAKLFLLALYPPTRALMAMAETHAEERLALMQKNELDPLHNS